MNLSQFEIGKRVKVLKIGADIILKKRLRSLGVMNGKDILILEESIGKQNMKISTGSTEIALRRNEAVLIEVEELK